MKAVEYYFPAVLSTDCAVQGGSNRFESGSDRGRLIKHVAFPN